MSDENLRELERAMKEAPDDAAARYRWRCALVRLGRAEEAGLELGDLLRHGPRLWRVTSLPSVGTRRAVFGKLTDLPGGRVSVMRVRERLEGSFSPVYETINRGSKRLGVLAVPVDPTSLRKLPSPPHTTSTMRLLWRPTVIRLLSETWALGATEEETRATLKGNAPENPSFAWRAYWCEARDLTDGWAHGVEPRKAPELPEPEMPLFRRGTA